jgi:hypothetical protein
MRRELLTDVNPALVYHGSPWSGNWTCQLATRGKFLSLGGSGRCARASNLGIRVWGHRAECVDDLLCHRGVSVVPPR